MCPNSPAAPFSPRYTWTIKNDPGTNAVFNQHENEVANFVRISGRPNHNSAWAAAFASLSMVTGNPVAAFNLLRERQIAPVKCGNEQPFPSAPTRPGRLTPMPSIVPLFLRMNSCARDR